MQVVLQHALQASIACIGGIGGAGDVVVAVVVPGPCSGGWLVPNQPTSCGYRGYRSDWEAILLPMGYGVDAYTVEAIEPK